MKKFMTIFALMLFFSAFQANQAAADARFETTKLQYGLNAQGFEAGQPDGIRGTKTQTAFESWYAKFFNGSAPQLNDQNIGYWALLTNGVDPGGEAFRGRKVCSDELKQRGEPDDIWAGEWTGPDGRRSTTTFFVFGEEIVVANATCVTGSLNNPNVTVEKYEEYILFSDISPDGAIVNRALLAPMEVMGIMAGF